jgi:nucleoid DNA-binding protein
MTNKDFIRIIMRQNPSMFRDDIWKIVQLVFKGMREAIGTGESLLVPGLGTIYPAFVDAKEWKSPFDGEVKQLGKQVKLRFRPSKQMERHLTEKLLRGVFDGTESQEDESAEAEG